MPVASLTIKESRKLVLPLDTVVEALLHFDGKSHGPLSRGDVLQAEIVRDAQGDGIDVAVRSGASHIVDWHRFNFSSIAAAIISYCRARRIPLPYSGVKSLELTSEGIEFPHREHGEHLAQGGGARRSFGPVAALCEGL